MGAVFVNDSAEVYRSGDPARLARALADSDVALAVVEGPQLTVRYANPKYLNLFAGGGDRSTDEKATTLSGEIRQAALTALDHGRSVRLAEVPVGDRYFHVVCSPIQEESTNQVSVVTFDITDQVVARRELEFKHQRITVLEQATSAVAAETEPREELMALADSVVPALADACAVYLVDSLPGSGGVMQATRVACVIDSALGVSPPAPEIRLRLVSDRPTARAAREGRVILASGPQADPHEWGEHWLTALNPHSLMAVPIGAPGSVLGVVKLAATGRRPRFEASDIALMREITARVDVAVSHALRMQRTTEVALALQRGLLSDPPQVPGIDIRVRYRPAGPGLEVGGDWYDAFIPPDGGLTVTVGDVVGHDLYAASTMGQLRSMVQALACQPGAEPAAVLTGLNRLSSHLRVGDLSTIVHGRLRLSPRATMATFTWANAGHPAPLLLGPDASVTVLDNASSPLLGLTRGEYRQASVTVPAGATLLLYTDGLMEDPAHPSPDAIESLAALAQAHGHAVLDELCDTLIAAASPRDDIALLAARVRHPDEG